MKEYDIQRIIQYKLGPINISVQTTNPQLRCKMLNNRFAGEALEKIDRLYEAGIPMNGQIVLCKGVNDGQELERSIQDLREYLPLMESVSVVPVGLSKYREGLYPLEPFTKEEAGEVIDTVEKWQKVCYEEYGLHFIHASDEWYLLAERSLPEADSYDGYLQLENGVGMLRLLEEEFFEALEEKRTGVKPGRVSIATGLLAAPQIQKLADHFMEKYPMRQVEIFPIVNQFFGEQITVSGLLTGQDIREQLIGKDLGERLLLPCNLLRSGEEVFLDDMTLTELKNALQVPIDIVESNGQHLVACMLK
jgi:putative radical SAM enzyme (TIGR03279 family)